MNYLRAELPVHVPSGLMYPPPQKAMNPLDRKFVGIQPMGSSDIASVVDGTIVRFRFPAQGFLDCGKTMLRFGLNVVQNPTGNPFLESAGAASIIKRLVIRCNGQEIEDIQNYSDIHRWIQLTHAQDHLDYATAVMQGTEGNIVETEAITAGSRRYRAVPQGAKLTTSSNPAVPEPHNPGGGLTVGATAVASNTRWFLIPFLASGLLGPANNQYLPLWAMGNDFEVEITLYGPAGTYKDSQTVGALATQANVAPTGTLTLTGLRLEVQYVDVPDAYTKALLEKFKSAQAIYMNFSSWQSFNQVCQGATDIINIQHILSNAEAIFLGRKATTITAANGGMFQYHGGDFQSSQLQVGAKYYPSQPITTRTDLFYSLLEAVGRLNNTIDPVRIPFVNWGVDGSATTEAETLYAYNLRKYRQSGVLTGIPLEGSCSLTNTYTRSPNIASTNLIGIKHTRVLVLTAEGITILK